MLHVVDIKFDIGDTVYFMYHNKVTEAKIESVCLTNKIEYRVLGLAIEQSKLYHDKESLLRDL